MQLGPTGDVGVAPNYAGMKGMASKWLFATGTSLHHLWTVFAVVGKAQKLTLSS